MLKTLRQKSTAVIFQNPWWEYRKDNYEHPDGSDGEYHYIRTEGSVMVIAITEEKRIIFVRQYRYLNRREGLEFIGGGIKHGMTAEKSALEELQEEAGYTATKLTKMGEFNPMNGVTDEICNIYVAESLKKSARNTDSSEEFEIEEFEYREVLELIREKKIWDGMTLAAFALFNQVNKDFLA